MRLLAVLGCLAGASAGLAAGAEQRTFASPQLAAEALAAAVQAKDAKSQLLRIFGPHGDKLVTSGDAVAEKRGRDRFFRSYTTAHRIVMESGDKAILVIGPRDWPYPIPIVKAGEGWRFDTAAGAQEIVDRRIGRNELNAIAVCRAHVDAQREYAARDRNGDGVLEYATRIQSTPGLHDGLYWPAAENEEASPLGPLMAKAQAKGYWLKNSPGEPDEAYYGYYYRILTRQGADASGGAYDYVVKDRMIGGFALVAFPARHGASGIMTFIVNQDGVVYQRDLGADTDRLAREMAEFNPGPGWTPVPDATP